MRQMSAKGCAWKKPVKPTMRHEVVGYMRKRYGISERQACRVVALNRSTCQYRAKPVGNE